MSTVSGVPRRRLGVRAAVVGAKFGAPSRVIRLLTDISFKTVAWTAFGYLSVGAGRRNGVG